MADPVTSRNAAMAYGYGVENNPAAPGDEHGIRRAVEMPMALPPPGATPDNYQGANVEAQTQAQRTGLARPVGQSPKTADALLRMVHQGLLGLPGQDRARFLDAFAEYQQTLTNAMQGLKFKDNFIGGPPPANALPANYEAPAAAPQDAEAIAAQMGEDPNAIRAQLAAQQANPTPPQMMDYTGQGGPQGQQNREPTHRQTPMARAATARGF